MFRLAELGHGLLLGTVALFAASGCSVAVSEGGATKTAPKPGITASSYAEYDTWFAEWRDQFIECARAEGLNASVPGDGEGISGGSSPDRPMAEGIGLDKECIERVGMPPRQPPVNADVLRRLYVLYLDQAECLRNIGVPVLEPPSRETWVEGYLSDQPPWFPLDTYMRAGGDVVPALAECPEPQPRDFMP